MDGSALFRRAKSRFLRANQAERAAWIVGLVASSPVTVPIFLGFWARRRGQKRRARAVLATRRFMSPAPPPPKVPPDPEVEAALRAEPDGFALVRILGNDLLPRHKIGQSRENLGFILRHEPAFADCEKLWIVNRIIDPDEEDRIVQLLEAAGQTYEIIPFRIAEYAGIPLDFSVFDAPQILQSDLFHALDEDQQARVLAQIYRLRNAYAMHNNGARNRAIEMGRARAKWVLPFDGNCFLTEADWQHLRTGIADQPDRHYVVVPMARLGTNATALDPVDLKEAREEPQITFRRDAPERFDEAHPYGRRPKVELLARLGVEGPWRHWMMDPWDIPPGPVGAGAHRVGRAGMVRRLASGRADLESADRATIRARGIVRSSAILTTLARADRAVMAERGFHSGRTLLFDRAAVDRLAAAPEHPTSRAVAEAAKEARGRGPYSVTQKTDLPPGGNKHDYYHPAPYWWPDPRSRDGLPYIWQDGRRVPGTEMYDPESDRFDRTRFQMMCDDAIACALAWTAFGDTRARDHARTLVRTWFLDPGTAMTPHLRYAQVRRGHNGDEGTAEGIIEVKDLAYLLDAVRMVGDAELSAGLSEWLDPYTDWLLASAQGRKERRAKNNHGLYFDIQLAAIAAFRGDGDTLLDCYRQSCSRLGGHFDSTGAQPHELTRTLTQHYCAFNLQGWLTLLQMYRNCGLPIDAQPEIARLAGGVSWFLNHRGGDWPYPQEQPFDTDRFAPIAVHAARLGLRSGTDDADRSLAETRVRFHPHDGIPPFWPLVAVHAPAAPERGHAS